MSPYFQQVLKATRVVIYTSLLLIASPTFTQESGDSSQAETNVEDTWQIPDITNLPIDWWEQFEFSSPGVFRQRIARADAACR